MRHVHPLVEQLDLAATQLHRPDPSYGRFAIILTDNVVELMLHRACLSEFERDQVFGLSKPKYDASTRKEALSERFDPKVKFAKRISWISEEQADFIMACHRYRNQLYHVGIRYDDIISDLAWQYHDFACELFKTYRQNGFVLIPRERCSPAVLRHTNNNGLGRAGSVEDSIANCAASLKAAKPAQREPLNESLARYAQKKSTELIEALDFLVHDNPAHMSEAATIEHVQFHDHLWNEDSPLPVEKKRCADLKDFEAAIATVKADWTPRYRKNPLGRWARRALDLTHEKDPMAALRKFDNLRAEMSYLERLILGAAAALDQHIDQQIMEARGK